MNKQNLFYTLLLTQTLSLVGSRMSGIALGIYIFKTTGNTAPLLLFSFFNELPAMLGNSLAGVWVDRLDRRWVLILSDVGQAIGSLFLLLSFASGDFQLWHLYTVGFLQGACAMFQAPTQHATVTLLIPDEQRDRANALRNMSFPLAGVFAPALTGVFYGLIGISGIILIDLATFLLAVGVVFRISIPNPPSSEDEEISKSWRSGWLFLWATPSLLALILYETILNFLLNGSLELGIPYLITITKNEAITGTILAIQSLGGFVGAGWLAWRGHFQSRLQTSLSMYGMVAGMFLIFGLSRSPIILGTSIFFLIAGLQAGALFNSIYQAKIPPDLQGRVFAIIGQLGYLGATTSFILTGYFVDEVLTPRFDHPATGMSLIYVAVGLLILLLTALLFLMPNVRHIETRLRTWES